MSNSVPTCPSQYRNVQVPSCPGIEMSKIQGEGVQYLYHDGIKPSRTQFIVIVCHLDKNVYATGSGCTQDIIMMI